jgi:hypothetical protein
MRYVVFFTLVLIFTFSNSFAGVIYVPNDTTSIQGGIYLASTNDTVLVDEGIYYENINFNGKAITVASHFLVDGDTSHISNTIIDGSQPSNPDSGSVILFTSGEDTTSILCGFTITNGSGTKFYDYIAGNYLMMGGGIYIYESGAAILNNRIKNNSLNFNGGPYGGGISSLSINHMNGSLIIRNNDISNNSLIGSMAGGGGIMITEWSPACGFNYDIAFNQISNNTVITTDNWKAMGGGISLECVLPSTGSKKIRNNKIMKNELHCFRSFGGGIYIVDWDDVTPAYTNVYDSTPNPLIYNNIIIDNYSEYKCGGVSIWRGDWWTTIPCPGENIVSQPVLINNTINHNRAQDGTGLFVMNYVPLFMNNILWNEYLAPGGKEIYLGNETNPVSGQFWNNLYGDIEMYYSDIRDTAWVDSTKGIFNADPLFADTINYELSDSSPCIGAGIDSIEIGSIWYTIPKTCYLGRPRPSPKASNPDIGACESPLAVPTGLQQFTNNISLRYILHQNYPNPFNPSTTIQFDLPMTSEVTLKVFNILGEVVATLVSDRLSAGSYSYEWDASNLASGVYLYRLKAGDYIETRKMILMK